MSEFQVQWYPGHMQKAKRALPGVLKHARFVVEVADARAPYSTRNPELIALSQNRPRLLVLAKADLADPGATASWLSRLESDGERVLSLSLVDPGAPRQVTGALKALVKGARRDPAAALRSIPGLALPKVGREKARGLVVGIPNTGKSTLIRALGGRAERGDRPGVTRGIQEFALEGDLVLFDTPGMMWPRAVSGSPALRLAWLGCVGPAAFDAVEAGRELVRYLVREHPGRIAERYGVREEDGGGADELLEAIAARRGFFRGGPDRRKAAEVLISEFQKGLLGRITLERAE